MSNSKDDYICDIWNKYKDIQFVLKNSNIKDDKLPQTLAQFTKMCSEKHINKLRIAFQWIKMFEEDQIKQWKKIRAENPETYWEHAKMMGWGDSFQEVKELNNARRRVKKDWFHKDNLLVIKPVKEEKFDK